MNPVSPEIVNITATRSRLLSSSVLMAAKLGKEWSRGRKRFIDLRRVRVQAGNGGDGIISFKHPTSPKVRVGGPDGGDGGRGGDVVFQADVRVKTLRAVRTHYRARDGADGQGSYHQGSDGKGVLVKVPPGTVLRDYSSPNKDILHDLLTPGSSCVAAEGGEGGLGNARFSTTADRKPVMRTEGAEGEERVLEVELRTIADVGLVGFPNAGKSTLLRALSRARPKVASYPFTTLSPEIGVMERGGGAGREEEEEGDTAVEQVTIADIPGLVPGAHENRGLGHSFLRHIQRCPLLVLVLDASPSLSSSTSNNMTAQVAHLCHEMRLYDDQLLHNTCLIVANKIDTHVLETDSKKGRGLHNVGVDFERHLNKLQEETNLPVLPISASELWNIEPLKEALFRIASRFKLNNNHNKRQK